MSENNLFQFAQVITELPQNTNYHHRYLHIRKVRETKQQQQQKTCF